MAKRQGPRLIAISAALLGLMLWTASIASAQYPPGIGSLSVSSSTTTAQVGSTTDLTCQVLGTAGQPQPGVDCTFTIASQPGSDAGFVTGQASAAPAGHGLAFPSGQVSTQSVTKPTGTNGIATAKLNVGTTPGPIVVLVEANGIVSQVTVQASTTAVSIPTAGGLPVTGGEPPVDVSPALGLAMLAGLLVAGWKLRRAIGWTSRS